jgi:hypothetical protein
MANAGAGALGIFLLLGAAAPGGAPSAVETLKSTGALPAHVAGRFEEIGACQRAASGDYFIFDRRAHTVFTVPSSMEGAPREIVGVGVEPGRVLRPSAFDLAPDRTFVVADAPYGTQRVQIFFETGSRLGGFTLPGSSGPSVTLDGVVVNGVGSLQYTGKSVFVSRPEAGALIAEYATDGRLLRSFGDLRVTGQETDREVHVALNTGRVVVNPLGGFYYVFLAGAPQFRKYDAEGRLVFERHLQGPELDEYARTRPAVWPKRSGSREIPLVLPIVRAAEADASGNLWISLTVPFTYVYDASGERRRTVQFVGAGPLSPTSLSFDGGGRLLVTPGCYVFDVKGASPARNLAARGLTVYSQRVAVSSSPSVLMGISRSTSMRALDAW